MSELVFGFELQRVVGGHTRRSPGVGLASEEGKRTIIQAARNGLAGYTAPGKEASRWG